MKTSSKAGQWWKRYNEIPALPEHARRVSLDQYELMKELEVEDLREIVQIMDDEAKPNQRELLMSWRTCRTDSGQRTGLRSSFQRSRSYRTITDRFRYCGMCCGNFGVSQKSRRLWCTE